MCLKGIPTWVYIHSQLQVCMYTYVSVSMYVFVCVGVTVVLAQFAAEMSHLLAASMRWHIL